MKTKSSGMRNVLFLQTTNPANHVTQDDKKKSLSYKIYDYIRVELTYPIKEWSHILQNIKQENGH